MHGTCSFHVDDKPCGQPAIKLVIINHTIEEYYACDECGATYEGDDRVTLKNLEDIDGETAKEL